MNSELDVLQHQVDDLQHQVDEMRQRMAVLATIIDALCLATGQRGLEADADPVEPAKSGTEGLPGI